MNEKFLTINLKSFLALILTFILIFAVIAPTALAVSSNESYTKAEQKYEDTNAIKGDVLDFSAMDFSNSTTHKGATHTRGDSLTGNYSITKNEDNYTIRLENVTAKKIILPPDVADGKCGGKFLKKDSNGNIVDRKTHITIELVGVNEICGYGLTGYYVKGLTIKGSGSLRIVTHLEEKKENNQSTYYIIPGIFVETDAIDDKDQNKGFVFDNAHVTVINPYYWGIICNGDIELKNGSKLEVQSYAGIKKRAEAGDISTDKLFVNEGCTLKTAGQVLIHKMAEQKEQEKAREKEKYKNDTKKPEISAMTSDKEEVKPGKVYCENPTVTVTDDQKIKSITVNGVTIKDFTESSDTRKVFAIPGYIDADKEVTAVDMNNNETKFKFNSNPGHVLMGKELRREEPTCTTTGKSEMQYTCLVCKKVIKTETVTLNALGHNYKATNYTTHIEHKCTRCNYSYTTEIKVPVKKAAPSPKQQTAETKTVEQQQEAKKEESTPQVKQETKKEESTPQVKKENNTAEAKPVEQKQETKKEEVKEEAKNNSNNKLEVQSQNQNMAQSKPSSVVESEAKPATKSVVKLVNNKITASNFTKTASTKSQSFNINAKRLGNAKLTYKSNNNSVTVNSSGKVTIKSKFVGKATITITSDKTSKYNKTTKKITVTVKPSKVNISKVTNAKGKKLTVKWNKNTICGGYQIQISTDKNFKKNVKTVTIKKNSTVSNTISKLSKNKKYYVRIRGFKTVSKVNYYSVWSSIKNIKIKK